MEQILAHLVGDYILQTDRMAKLKTTSRPWALVHGIAYTVPFLFLTHSFWALYVIAFSHALIDHYRLARYVVMAKNSLTDWKNARYGYFNTPTGYPKNDPVWMTVWLYIITDNTIHLCVNFAALRWL